MATLQFASWNMNWFTRSGDSMRVKLDYLRDQSWDVVALQEVTARMHQRIVSSDIAPHVAYTPSIPDRGFGSALLARNRTQLEQISLLAELPKPQWGISAVVRVDGHAIRALSWHAPNAAKASTRGTKRAAYIAMNRWVCGRDLPLLVGTDANHGARFTRERDFPAEAFRPIEADDWLEENCFWAQSEHDLADVWLDYLERQPELLAKCRLERPDGPSVVSYVRGSKNKPVPDRFDYVLASPEFTATSMSYEPEAFTAGSDHAFVTATLEYEASGRRTT